MRARANIVRRQLRLLSTLGRHPRGLSSERLAKELGASRATIDRDLATLRDSAIATIHRKRIGGEVWHVLDGLPLSISITPGQLAALRLARSSLGALEASATTRELDALLGATSPPSRSRIAVVPKRRRPSTPLAIIETALDRGQRLDLVARVASRGGGTSRYTVDPLALRVVDGDAYLHAWAIERGGVRTFKLDRIQSAVPTGESVEERPEIDVDALFESAVKAWSGEHVTVRVRIVRAAAWAVGEYPLVGDQRIVHEADGSVIVEAHVAGLVEVSRWVLGWGKNAEVLSPPALREAMRAELDSALAHYRDGTLRTEPRTLMSGPDAPTPAAAPKSPPRSTARTTQVRERART